MGEKSPINTLGPRQNGRHFPDDIFKCIFLNENVWISIKISLNFVPRCPVNYIPALVQIMAWRRPGDKPLSEPMIVGLPTHICITRPQWVNTLWPEDLHRWTGCSLVQVMIWHCTTPSHYLNQCWLTINWTPRNKLQSKFNQNTQCLSQENSFENVVCKILAILSLPQCIDLVWLSWSVAHSPYLGYQVTPSRLWHQQVS